MRIRGKIRAHGSVPAGDRTWLLAYEKTNAENRGDYGRSKSGSRKTVSFHTEEETATEAEGSGAAAATAAGMMVREEGRMLNTIVDRGINALVEAVKTYRSITLSLMEERKQDAMVQRSLIESVRGHYVARAEAEGDIVRMKAEIEAAKLLGDDSSPLETAALEAILGKLMNGGSIPTAGNTGNGKKP